ncbi:uncharacterized protein LOC131675776 [Phymastichus coffea]|uniref:uncharacterized protein LOC131675776 n=1 Tax=Phymastichus coffea TaxID=108790 RepID=UPI00273C8CD8|nr:uncharacterized protein LOC131675776 [Phymastichus coffea]
MNLREYQEEVKKIKNFAIKNNVSEDKVNKIFGQCFKSLEEKPQTRVTTVLKFLKIFVAIFLIVILSSLVLYNHPKTHNVLLRNIQSFIYPGLKIFRKVAVPIITLYPSLTVWYDEWCLVENPYFQLNEMDCWPCNSVNSVKDLTGFNITQSFNNGIPFIRSEKIKKVNVNELLQIYSEYQDNLNTDSEQLQIREMNYRTINEIMHKNMNNPYTDRNAHMKWRINQMELSRKLRKLFPKLPGTPDWWSPSTEKFIFIDEPNASDYVLPHSECANVIIQCTNGERLIQLNPSPECTQNCQRISVLLSNNQSLWYNWWYWRPVSLPSNNTTAITIMYLSSFC